MGTHVAKLGRSLDAAVASYNQTVSSLESRVLVTARKLTDLEVADGELPAPGAGRARAAHRSPRPSWSASAADSLIALHELDRAERESAVRWPRNDRPEPRATVNG